MSWMSSQAKKRSKHSSLRSDLPIGEPRRAACCAWRRMLRAVRAFDQFFPHLLLALSNAAGPDRVLTNLDRSGRTPVRSD